MSETIVSSQNSTLFCWSMESSSVVSSPGNHIHIVRGGGHAVGNRYACMMIACVLGAHILYDSIC